VCGGREPSSSDVRPGDVPADVLPVYRLRPRPPLLQRGVQHRGEETVTAYCGGEVPGNASRQACPLQTAEPVPGAAENPDASVSRRSGLDGHGAVLAGDAHHFGGADRRDEDVESWRRIGELPL
jgi:hypothetical protein